MVTVSAPGKLLFFGEHAVVYGQPCIVTAVDQRLTVIVEKNDKLSINAPQVKETKFVDAAVAAFCSKYKKDKSVTLSIKSQFSHQVGFGSSSAVTVATVKALSLLFDVKLSDQEIFDICYQVTLEIQGVGSGFDIAAAIWGSTLYFKKGGSVIDPMNISDIPLIVGYTGVKADTPTLVRQVAEKQKKYPEKVNKIFSAIGKLVEEARTRMQAGEWERVGKLMDFNQEYLRDLGVSSEKLEAMISAAKTGGAWGAKLSGAGGGDCMIALVESVKREAVRKAIEEVGGQVIDVRSNAQGVRVEQ
jgi:mevalonate kinase